MPACSLYVEYISGQRGILERRETNADLEKTKEPLEFALPVLFEFARTKAVIPFLQKSGVLKAFPLILELGYFSCFFVLFDCLSPLLVLSVTIFVSLPLALTSLLLFRYPYSVQVIDALSSWFSLDKNDLIAQVGTAEFLSPFINHFKECGTAKVQSVSFVHLLIMFYIFSGGIVWSSARVICANGLDIAPNVRCPRAREAPRSHHPQVPLASCHCFSAKLPLTHSPFFEG